MLKIIERIGEILLSQQERALELRELKVQFIRDRKSIMHHLKLCKKSKGIIGLYATRLGKGMFLGTITSIYHNVITLRPVDDNDAMVKTIMLPLDEITSICPFNQIYSEPEEVEETAPVMEEQLRLVHIN
jgi:hypothetical protein